MTSFPINPTLNQTHSIGSKTWKWNGTGWELIGAVGPIGPTGPTGPGYVNVPQNSQDGSNYLTVLSDSGKHILHPSADSVARTFTIDSGNVNYDIGTTITFINQNNAGTLTIAISTHTMRMAGSGATGSRTLAANGIATAIKISSTEWIINGVNLS